MRRSTPDSMTEQKRRPGRPKKQPDAIYSPPMLEDEKGSPSAPVAVGFTGSDSPFRPWQPALSERGMLVYELAKSLAPMVGSVPDRFYSDVDKRVFDIATRLVEQIEVWDAQPKKKPEQMAILIDPTVEDDEV